MKRFLKNTIKFVLYISIAYCLWTVCKVLSVIYLFVTIIAYSLNRNIKTKISQYDRYPTSVGNASRNYEVLRIGTDWLYNNRNTFPKNEFIESMYCRTLPMMEFCLYKLFSLVREGGEVILYLDKKNCIEFSDYKSLVDKSYFWPCERELYNIKYNMFCIRYPLFADFKFFTIYILKNTLYKIYKKKIKWRELDINETSINEESKIAVKRMKSFCLSRNLSFKLLVEE